MYRWEVTENSGRYFASLMNDEDNIERTHPIWFSDKREAVHAVFRLNKRDFDE